MAKISDEPFGDFKPKSATGPAGASRFELPSFTKGISPQLLIDNAKSQGIITAKQQADFKNRVGKDRTALAEFNEIVKKSKNPNLQYRGITPDQLEMIKEKKLFPMTAANKPERINLINDVKTKLDDAAKMDAPKKVKVETFIKSMKEAYGDFANNPVVKRIANGALKVLQLLPSGPLDALDFMPSDLLENLQQEIGIFEEGELPMAAQGGMMNINDMITPVGYKMGTRKGKLVGDKEKGIATIQIGLMEDVDDINIQGMKLLLQEAADSLDELDKIDKLSSKEIINMFQDLMSKKGT